MRKINLIFVKSALIRGGSALLSLYLQIWIVGQFGGSKYGDLVLFLTVCSFFLIISKGGADQNIVRMIAIAENKGNSCLVNRVARSVVIYSIVSCFLTVSISSFVDYWFFSSQLFLKIGFLKVFLGVVLMFSINLLLACMRGQGKFIAVDFFDGIFKNVLFIAISLFASVVFVVSALDLIYLQLFVFFIQLIIVLKVLIGIAREWTLVNYKLVFGEVIDHMYFIMIGLLGFVYFQFDTYVLAFYVTSFEVGAYNMACNFVRLIIFIPLIVAAQIQPKIAIAFNSGDFLEVNRITVRSTMLSLGVATIAYGFLFLLGRLALRFVDEGFVISEQALLILGVAHIFNSYVLVSNSVLIMLKRQKVVFAVQFFGAIPVVIGYYFLIPKYGQSGAGLSVLFGMLIVCLTYFFAIFKMGRVRF